MFLATPRGWDELGTWASERGMSGNRLRNMLAWLEGEGIAGASADRTRVVALGARRSVTWRRFDGLAAVS